MANDADFDLPALEISAEEGAAGALDLPALEVSAEEAAGAVLDLPALEVSAEEQVITDGALELPALTVFALEGGGVEVEDSTLSFGDASDDTGGGNAIFEEVVVTEATVSEGDMTVADDPIILSESYVQVEYVQEALTVTEATEQYGFAPLVDEVVLSDATQTEAEFELSDATLRLRDTTVSVGANLIADSFVAADAQSDVTSATVADSVTVTETLDLDVASSTDVSDTSLELSDATSTAYGELAEDSFVVEDALQLTQVQLVSDISLELADTQALAVQPAPSLVADQVVLSEALDLTTEATDFITETLVVTDAVVYRDTSAMAWVMNTETTAMHTYENWQVLDTVQYVGRTFAVGTEGLLEVTGTDDAGVSIEADVDYGFVDFGVEEKKRMEACWFGYTSEGVLTVSVETYGQGYPVYSYAMPARSADQPVNNYVFPGRALLARYWRLGVSNTDGAAFDVKVGAAKIIPTKRRA